MRRALSMAMAVGIGLGAGPGALFAADRTRLAPATSRPASTDVDPALVAVVGAALTAAATMPDVRVEVESVEQPRAACAVGIPARVEVSRAVDGSARAAIKLIGAARGAAAPCAAWSWVRFRLLARVPVTIRTVRAGEPLGEATRLEEREIKVGHAPADPSVVGGAATADRSFIAGQMVEADALRAPGPRPGDTVKILLVAGSLAIEETGRAVSCARNHSCAVLPSGKHVDGTFADGRLVVQLP